MKPVAMEITSQKNKKGARIFLVVELIDFVALQC